MNWILESLSDLQQAEVVINLKRIENGGTTLRAVVDYWEENHQYRHRTITLGEMVDLTIRTKQGSRRRERYVDQLEKTLKRFAKGRETLPLAKVDTQMLNEFTLSLGGRNGGGAAASTIHSALTRLRTMFSFACKKDTYLDASANPMKDYEMPMVDSVTPIILTPENAGKYLWVCRVTDPEFLAYIVLGMFCGIRPEELEKLRWADIHIDEREIVIERAVSKVRQRRVINLNDVPCAVPWLEEIRAEGLITGEYIFEGDATGDRLATGPATQKLLRSVRQCIRRHRRNLCTRSGVKWHQDFLRKTAASVLMWKHGNETKVSGILGNSPDIVFEHYRALIRRKDGEAFIALTPDNVKNDPIELPVGGKGKKAGLLIGDKSPFEKSE